MISCIFETASADKPSNVRSRVFRLSSPGFDYSFQGPLSFHICQLRPSTEMWAEDLSSPFARAN